jgi:hypothetical protein
MQLLPRLMEGDIGEAQKKRKHIAPCACVLMSDDNFDFALATVW